MTTTTTILLLVLSENESGCLQNFSELQSLRTRSKAKSQ
jgi:hypothetical protein